MRSGAGRITASLLAVALCLLSAGPALATDGGPAGVDQSDSPPAVMVAQEGGSDEDSDTGLRLIDRTSTSRVDAVVIALWTIAAGMTVMLAVFLWHTSPRRRLRLARTRSAHLADEADEDAEAEGDEDDSEAEGDEQDGDAEEAGETEEADEAEPSEMAEEKSEAADEDDGGQGFWPRPGDARGLD